jgi:hypothetical protein
MRHKQAISQSIDRNNDNFKYTDTNIIFQILISFIFWTFIEELRINMCMHRLVFMVWRISWSAFWVWFAIKHIKHIKPICLQGCYTTLCVERFELPPIPSRVNMYSTIIGKKASYQIIIEILLLRISLNIIFQILISFIFWTFIEELRINMCMHKIKIDQ